MTFTLMMVKNTFISLQGLYLLFLLEDLASLLLNLLGSFVISII